MMLTDHELLLLRTRSAKTIEVKDIQARLFANGLRFCPYCDSVKPTRAFVRAPLMTHGLSTGCRECRDYARSTGTPLRSLRVSPIILVPDDERMRRYFRRHPDKRPKSARGRYTKTVLRGGLGISAKLTPCKAALSAMESHA